MNQKTINQKAANQQTLNQKAINQQPTDKIKSLASNSSTSFQDARGTVPYGMTNDYMFRAVLQKNNKALRGLICALLHLRQKDVMSVEITNPIELGKSVNSKEFRLDINVRLNNHTLINLEMQVTSRLSWPNRSVSYLCRSFDSLNHGQDYQEIEPVIHIGFLDYTLFNGYPEFYATYKLLNVKNYHLYSDNLTLSVVDLSRIDLATDEDKKYHIDYWAKLFKATTWEEIKMLAVKDQYIKEASKTIFEFSADEQILKLCRDCEEYHLDINAYERTIAEQGAALTEKDAAIAERDASIAEKNAALADKDALLEKTVAEKDSIIQKLLAENERLRTSAVK